MLPGTTQAATKQDKYVPVQFTENNEISRSGAGNLDYILILPSTANAPSAKAMTGFISIS